MPSNGRFRTTAHYDKAKVSSYNVFFGFTSILDSYLVVDFFGSLGV